MPTGSGTGTETYSIGTEAEWSNGTFTNTATDGSGSLILGPHPSESFDYSINSEDQAVTSTIEIRDANTSTVLTSDTVTNTSASSTIQIDTTTHPDLEFYAEVDDQGSGVDEDGTASISIADSGAVLVSLDTTGSGVVVATDTATESYTYSDTGSWTSPAWDFTNTTTATKLSWSGVVLPNAGDDITVTVENADASSTHTESLAAGSGSVLFDISADDQYRLSVDVTTGDDDTTPELGSLTLETHTSTGDTLVVDAVSGVDTDLSWGGVSVADGYQILRAQDTGTTPGDYSPLASTTQTSYTDSSGDAGVQYYYRVRAEYMGE